jgi:hypothetical protein
MNTFYLSSFNEVNNSELRRFLATVVNDARRNRGVINVVQM